MKETLKEMTKRIVEEEVNKKNKFEKFKRKTETVFSEMDRFITKIENIKSKS